MKKKRYEAPQTRYLEVELEQGFMVKASIFEPENGHDKGVSIGGHSIGNSGNYFDNPDTELGDKWNQWD